MFIKYDSFMLKDRQYPFYVLALLFCKNRAKRYNIFSLVVISDGYGIINGEGTNYCEKHFTIISTNST
jgi:hypothetical protein